MFRFSNYPKTICAVGAFSASTLLAFGLQLANEGLKFATAANNFTLLPWSSVNQTIFGAIPTASTYTGGTWVGLAVNFALAGIVVTGGIALGRSTVRQNPYQLLPDMTSEDLPSAPTSTTPLISPSPSPLDKF